MESTVLKLLECGGCGAPLEAGWIKDGLCRCKYCSYTNIMPKDDQKEEVLLLLHDGDSELRNSSFERAYNAYRQAADMDPEESKAYFGMALAANRVKYIKDTVNKCCQPICFEVTDRRFDSDKNFSLALEYASSDSQYREYENKAREIDYIREKFSELSKNTPRFDTFICVKVSDGEGGFTQDSVWAGKLYDSIKRTGIIPFYSERDIGDRVGEDYEALILYALFTAKSLIIVCSDEDYLRTPWVQNEYSRYYAMLADKEKAKNSIMIAFRGNVIERIPGIPGKIQGVNLSSFDASQKVNEFAKKFAEPEEEKPKEVKLCVNCGAECDKNTNFCPLCGSREFAKDRDELIKLKAEAKLRQEAEAKEREEAEKKRREESEKRAKEEFERRLRDADEKAQKAREEFERRQKEESDRRAKEAEAQRNDYFANAAPAVPNQAAPKAADLKYCSKCGTENGINVKFCAECGNSEFVASNKKFCAECESANQLTAKFCAECGNSEFVSSVDELMQIKAQRQAKLTAEEARRYVAKNFRIQNGTLVKYVGSDIIVTVPPFVNTIGKEAFADSAIESVTLLSTVKTISPGAFKNCSRLSEVNLAEGIKTIGDYAFYGCASLCEINLPDGLVYVGIGAFDGCNEELSPYCEGMGIKWGLPGGEYVDTFAEQKYRIEYQKQLAEEAEKARAAAEAARIEAERVAKENAEKERRERELREYMARQAEEQKKNEARAIAEKREKEIVHALTSDYAKRNFILSGTVLSRYIGNDTDITVPLGVTEIASSAFYSKKNIKRISFPDTLRSIGKDAFWCCYALETVELSEGITVIEKNAFWGCKSMKSINIPKTVHTIENGAFFDCRNLSKVSITDLNAWIGINFVNNYSNPLYNNANLYLCGKQLTHLEIPSGVTEIKPFTFYGCKSLTSVTIPRSVTSIGKEAFYECQKLISVVSTSSLKITAGTLANGWVAFYAKMPSVITRIGDFEFAEIKGSYYLISYDGDKADITLPESYKGLPYDIYQFAFYKNIDLKRVTVPVMVGSAAKNAFIGCENLTIRVNGSGNSGSMPKSWHRKSVESDTKFI